MVRIECPQMLVHRDAARHRNVRVRRLVGPFPGAEPGMPLEGIDDPVEQRLLAQLVVDAGERQPELQSMSRGGVEFLRHRQHLLVRASGRPDGVVADEVDTGAGDLRPGTQTAARRRPVERRRIGKTDRKDALAADQQVTRRWVD
jgi:hypothetical protein